MDQIPPDLLSVDYHDLLTWHITGDNDGLPAIDPLPSSVKDCLDFSFVFSAPLPPEETCFQQVGSSAVEGTSQVVLGSSD
jgi:hypothetical protein